MRRTPVAHIVFPRPHAARPVAEFVWDAARQVAEARDLELEVLMPVPMASARTLSSRARGMRGQPSWPEELEAILGRLDPKPTLIPYLPVPRRSIESATASIGAHLIARRRARRPAVIHGSFLDQGGYAAAVCARALGVGAIAVAHGTDTVMARTGADSGRARRALSTLRYAHDIVCVSHALAAELAHLGRNAELVRYGADEQRFPLNPRSGGPTRILFVGSLSRGKGVDVLVEALSLLRHRDARLRLVGPPGDVDVEAVAKAHGVIDRVELAGEALHADLSAHYRDASLVVLPSRAEGFGCVLVEALLSGRPIVTTQVGGMVEIASRDVGDVVPSEDPRALAEALDAVLDRSFEPARLRAAAEAYTWGVNGPRLVELTRARVQHGA